MREDMNCDQAAEHVPALCDGEVIPHHAAEHIGGAPPAGNASAIMSLWAASCAAPPASNSLSPSRRFASIRRRVNPALSGRKDWKP